MNVLHISVAGITDRFYVPFLLKMNNISDIKQYIYIPYDKKKYKQKDLEILSEYKENNIKAVVPPIKRDVDRVLYFHKIRKYFDVLEENVDIRKINICHAHSLYSDGGVAYLMKKKYGIPYVVAVRSTDTTIFMKYFPYLRKYGRKIIGEADRVVFITHSLEKQTKKILYSGRKKKKLKKISYSIIPNGINEFWIKNKRSSGKQKKKKEVRIIQVSRLIAYKNVDKTIRAVNILKGRGFNVHMDVLGEGKNYESLKNLSRILNLKNEVTFWGFVSDLDKIKEHYANNDIFVMPSLNETFGITYIEAMSQGLPIVGIKGTGVSGFFKNDSVGIFLEDAEPDMIADAIEKIVSNYDEMSENALNSIEAFDWNRIIRKYEVIYKEILRM